MAAPGIRIRRARLADATAVARVMRAAVRAAAGPYRAAERAAWASLPALYHRWAMTAGGEVYLVAERGGRIAGYAAVLLRGLGAPSPAGKAVRDPSPPGRLAGLGAEVTAVFVAPSAAGRGIGAALLARLVARARADGVRALSVDAAAGAVPFYAACGFRPGRAIRVPLPGGRTLPARRMTLRLTGGRRASGTRTAGSSRPPPPSGTPRAAPRSRRDRRAPPSSR